MSETSKEKSGEEVIWESLLYPFINFVNSRIIEDFSTVFEEPELMRFHDYHETHPDLTIVIPVSGRVLHLARSLECLYNQISAQKDKNILVVVCEMGEHQQHKELCEYNYVDYLYLNSMYFNKSFAMNWGAQLFPAETFLFYDVDLLVGDDWLARCIDTIEKLNEESSSWVFQPIEERKIYYINPENTASIFAGDKKISDIELSEHSVQESWYKGEYPPGGMMMVSSNLFYAVQGYDSALFWGYSPEDSLFLKRCLRYSDSKELGSWDKDESIKSEVFHMFHESSEYTNFSYQYMTFVNSLLEKNELAMKWYSQEKLRWGYLRSFSAAPLMRNKEERITGDIVQSIFEIYLEDKRASFKERALTWLNDRFPKLRTENKPLYLVHEEYIDFIDSMGSNFLDDDSSFYGSSIFEDDEQT